MNNFKFIEVDLALTHDGKLVCSHGLNISTYEKTKLQCLMNTLVTYDAFMNSKILDKFTTIDANYIATYMRTHDDVYFELDLRDLDYQDSINIAKEIIQVFGYDLLDRLLIQVYTKQMYYAINSDRKSVV